MLPLVVPATFLLLFAQLQSSPSSGSRPCSICRKLRAVYLECTEDRRVLHLEELTAKGTTLQHC